MIFSLTVNILISIGLVLLISGFYLLINTLINRKEEKLNKALIFIFYLLLFLIIIASILFALYIWGVEFQEYVSNTWKTIIGGFLDKTGAIISTVLIFVFAGFILKIFKILVARSYKYMRTANERRKHTIIKITSSIVRYIVYLSAILIILAIWGVNVLPALAGLGILGLVVGLGAQDLIKDIIAGFFIVFEKHFDVGDMVEINGFKGEVIDIGLKTTRVKNWKQDVKIFNNSSVQNAINYSITESLAIVEFRIAYESDIDKTLEVLKTELPKTREVIPELIADPVCAGVIALAESSVNLRVVAKTKTEQHYGAERVLRKEIKKILDNANIEIPFPQVVLHNADKEK